MNKFINIRDEIKMESELNIQTLASVTSLKINVSGEQKIHQPLRACNWFDNNKMHFWKVCGRV